MKNSPSVGILDYGTGNIASLFKAIKTVGGYPYLIQSKTELLKSEKLILPGVGHFRSAIESLNKNEMFNTLIKVISSGVPVLGICLGFQLLTQSSEESPNEKGLNILPLKTIRIQPKNISKYKVPHMGWNNIKRENKKIMLLNRIEDVDKLFYFSNSYGIVKTNKESFPLGKYFHETDWIAMAEYKNVFGVQFHPEKSRKQGLKILKNFLLVSSYL